MVKVLLVHSITHNGLEYLPGLHDIDEELVALWRREAPHVMSSIPVSKPGQIQRAADFRVEEEEIPVGTATLSSGASEGKSSLEGTRSSRKKRK